MLLTWKEHSHIDHWEKCYNTLNYVERILFVPQRIISQLIFIRLLLLRLAGMCKILFSTYIIRVNI